MKKLLSIVLTLALCMGLSVTAFASNSVGNTTVETNKFSYTLSQPIIETNEYDYWGRTITVYFVPAGTVVSAPAGRVLAPVYTEYMEGFGFGEGGPGEYRDTVTIELSESEGVIPMYKIGSVSAEDAADAWYPMEDSGVFLAATTAAAPETPAEQPTTDVPAEIPASGMSYARSQTITVDGKAVEFQTYALKDERGYETNYVKVRDLAHTLNGTAAQFQVGWNGDAQAIELASKTAYTANGSEMTTPFGGDRTYTLSAAATYVDGAVAELTAITLTDDMGGGYTYYKLRDLGEALGFEVDWSAEIGIILNTK